MTPELEAEVIRRNVPQPLAKKINSAADKIKWQIPAEQRDPEFIAQVKDFLEAAITEESTDVIVDAVAEAVPWGLGWLVGKVLDRMLPEKLLSMLWVLLDKVSD